MDMRPAEMSISDNQFVILFDPENDNYIEVADVTLTVNVADLKHKEPFMMLVTIGRPGAIQTE